MRGYIVRWTAFALTTLLALTGCRTTTPGLDPQGKDLQAYRAERARLAQRP